MTTPTKFLAGSQLEWLYCPYGGFPIDKITWDKDGKQTPTLILYQIVQSNFYEIFRLAYKYQGRYFDNY